MHDLLNLELTAVLLTLLAYQAGAWLQKKTKSPICNLSIIWWPIWSTVVNPPMWRR